MINNHIYFIQTTGSNSGDLKPSIRIHLRVQNVSVYQQTGTLPTMYRSGSLCKEVSQQEGTFKKNVTARAAPQKFGGSIDPFDPPRLPRWM